MCVVSNNTATGGCAHCGGLFAAVTLCLLHSEPANIHTVGLFDLKANTSVFFRGCPKCHRQCVLSWGAEINPNTSHLLLICFYHYSSYWCEQRAFHGLHFLIVGICLFLLVLLWFFYSMLTNICWLIIPQKVLGWKLLF